MPTIYSSPVLWVTLALISLSQVGYTQTTSLNIPVKANNGWLELKYSSIPANAVSFASNGLSIDIDGSASPLIYPLSKELKVHRVQVHARIEGQITGLKGKKQGQKGADDFTLRLGLVESGSKTLSVWQKSFAASWIKKLFSLAPKGSGIEKILFLNVPEDPNLRGSSRVHPLSNLIEERFLAPANKGSIRIDYKFKTPLKTVALWLSSDGDDTKSKYRIVISKIKLTTAESK